MRRSLDTNLLVRLILRDDTQQAQMVEEILNDDCWVSLTVAVELYWVLLRWAKQPREAVCEAFELVMAISTIRFEQQDGLRWAVQRCRVGADLPDMMHIVASAYDADIFTTFDQKLVKQAGVDTPLEIVTMRA